MADHWQTKLWADAGLWWTLEMSPVLYCPQPGHQLITSHRSHTDATFLLQLAVPCPPLPSFQTNESLSPQPLECCTGSSIISCLDTIYFFVKANEYFHWHSIGHGKIVLFKIIFHFLPLLYHRGTMSTECCTDSVSILIKCWFWGSLAWPRHVCFGGGAHITLRLLNGKCYKIFLIPPPN